MSVLAVEIPYWGQSLLRVLGGIVAVLLPAGTIVYVFLFKMMSFMQSRLGPMEAGPYGSMQLFAEVGKWLQKEDLSPDNADRRIFRMAPLIVLASTFLLVAVVPFGPDAWFTDFEAGVFYALAVSSISSRTPNGRPRTPTAPRCCSPCASPLRSRPPCCAPANPAKAPEPLPCSRRSC